METGVEGEKRVAVVGISVIHALRAVPSRAINTRIETGCEYRHKCWKYRRSRVVRSGGIDRKEEKKNWRTSR